MTNVTTIDTNEGTITINSEEFIELYNRFKGLQAEIDANKEAIKEVVQQAADATKMKKGKVAKYMKSRYDFKTKEAVELGQLFDTLNEVIDG